MNVTRLWLCLVILLISAHRLPAPISEIPETPKPAPEQSAKPKPKRTIKPKVASESSEPSTRRQTPSPQSKSEAASNRKPFDIPQSQMTASATSQHSGNEASKAIDGKVNTIWHTDFNFFSAPTVSLPQSILLSLGGTYNANALHYLPRQDGGPGSLNGNIITYRVYASTDGSNFTLITTGNWMDDHTEKTATFTATRASYIRLEAVAGHGGHASAAELNVSATR